MLKCKCIEWLSIVSNATPIYSVYALNAFQIIMYPVSYIILDLNFDIAYRILIYSVG